MSEQRPAFAYPSEQPASRPLQELREVRGVIERVTYQNPDTGYTVARMALERPGEAPPQQGGERLLTLVGELPDVQPGEAVVARGWWRHDPKYGWQLQVREVSTVLPATLQGMHKYLGSGLVRGIGPVLAERIVQRFREATFEVLDAEPQRLREVEGIGPVRAARILAAWAEQRHIREVMATLQSYGVSTSLAARIYKRFGAESGRVLTHEPYRLAREVWGIGFKTADRIAQAVGIARDDPARLEAGVLYALGEAADQGHTLLPMPELAAKAAALLGAEGDQVQRAIGALVARAELVAGARAGEQHLLLALLPFARAEVGIARRLGVLSAARERAQAAQAFGHVRWETAFAWLAERHGLRLAPEQEAAVRMALTEPVSVLTGGPGTGKTHSLRALLALARAKRLRCLLAAPTGRAAKRMEEATGHPAATLHRLLGLRPGGAAERGPANPLEADLVVVDEASMLDVLLAYRLLKALAPGTHLLLVGDPDQLPSVGAGDVLADLLRSGRVPTTRLERLYRQGAGSGIARNARRVLAGEMPVFGSQDQDCLFLPADEPAEAARLVAELVAERLPRRFGLRPGDVQVLAPMHRGQAGVGMLNTLLQERLNPWREGMAEARSGGRAFRPGDRVLQLRNDYELGVFNGDLGTVRSVDPYEQELRLAMDDGREVRYPQASLFALAHAFAISFHKAQGGEFPAVVLPLLTSHAPMLGRTLLYTALTRARQLLVVVGQRRALALAVRDWRRDARHTALGGLLAASAPLTWRNEPDPDADDGPVWEDL